MHISSTDASDFLSPSKQVTLSPNATRQCVNIVTLEDSELEETEFLTLSLSLTSEQNSVSLSQQNATVYITDNGRLQHKPLCACTYLLTNKMCIYSMYVYNNKNDGTNTWMCRERTQQKSIATQLTR